jgi:Papain family cysteine protease
MSRPERVDLRVGACFPYLPVESQGAEQSCLVHSFAAALHCLKARSNLPRFPRSRLDAVDFGRVFAEALGVSPDRSRGTSFEDVIESLLREHLEDLRALGWQIVRLQNSVEQCKRRLREGVPVVAGYQVNRRISAFHQEPDVCERHGFLLPSFAAEPAAVSAHAVLVVGFDDALGCFLARNSWGPGWGVDGHFLVRYQDLADAAFFTDLVSFYASATPSARRS